MKRKWIKLFLLISILPLLTSCWDQDEPNRMRYVYGIGIDYKEGKYEVYTQIIDFTNIAKSESPTQDAIQVEVGKGTGHNVEEALYNLYHSLDLKLYWGHLTFVVFSEEALKDGRANTIINSFIRYRETRYQTWVYATTEPVEEILLLNPLFNNTMTRLRLADPMSSYEQESYIEPINFRKLIIRLNEPPHEVNLPYVTMKEWKTEKEEDKLPDFDGVAIFTPDDFKGFIKKEKAGGLQWMTNETKAGEITQKRDKEGDYITAVIDNLKVKVKPSLEGNQVYFDIKLNLNVLLGSFEGNISEDEVKKYVKERMKKEIEETYLEGLKHEVDIYRLSEYVYRQKLSIWKKYQKDGKVELKEDSIRSISIDINKVYSGRKKFKETIE